MSDQRAVLPMAGDAQSLEAEVQQQLAEQRQALEDVRSALEAAGSAHSAESAELLVACPSLRRPRLCAAGGCTSVPGEGQVVPAGSCA